jgi:hypothetical protein
MRTPWHRSLRGPFVVSVGLALAAIPSAAAVQAGHASETVDVVEIEVPVRVLVGDEPVRGLTGDDFTLVAGGRKRPILGFSAIDLEAPADDGATAPVAELPLGRPVPFAERSPVERRAEAAQWSPTTSRTR